MTLRDLILNTKLWAVLAGVILLLMLALGLLANLMAANLQPGSASLRTGRLVAVGTAGVLVFALGCCAVPIMVRLVLGFQQSIGNGEVPMVAFLLRHEIGLVVGFWALFLAGLLVAAPHFIRAALSDEETAPASALERQPLEYQIDVSRKIVLAKTRMQNGAAAYEVQEVWRSLGYEAPGTPQSLLSPQIAIHRRAGYVAHADQPVVLFFPADDEAQRRPFLILPVQTGRVVYAPQNPALRRDLAVGEFKDLVRTRTGAALRR